MLALSGGDARPLKYLDLSSLPSIVSNRSLGSGHPTNIFLGRCLSNQPKQVGQSGLTLYKSELGVLQVHPPLSGTPQSTQDEQKRLLANK